MNKQILKLAIPNILSNISVPLLSTVDTILMGHLSMLHLGAIGLGAMVFNFIYWNFGFLRMGTTGMTAQAYGRKDDQDIKATLFRALCIAFLVAMLMLVLLKPFYELMSYLLNISSEQEQMVYDYYKIRMIAAPATLMLYVYFGWFFGLQNALIPLVLTISLNVVNIVVSAFLVRQLGWGIEGAAYGTVIAQYIGVLMAYLISRAKYPEYTKNISKGVSFAWSKMKDFLSVNRDIFLRTVCLTSVFLFFYSQSSKAGLVILGVNVVLLQFLNWMSYGIDGFAYASESLVGRYFGANDDSSYFKSIQLSFIWAAVLAGLYSLIYGIGGEYLIPLFTNEESVILASAEFLPWMIVLPLLGFASYIWDGIYVGQTASRSMLLSMFYSLIVFFILYFLLGGMEYSTHNIWIAFTAFLVARAVFQTWLFMKYKKALS